MLSLWIQVDYSLIPCITIFNLIVYHRSFKQEPFLDLSLSLDISSKVDIPSSAPNIMQTNIHQGISSYSGRRSVSHGGITNVTEQQKTKKTKYEKKVKHGIKSNSVDLRDCLKEFTNQEVLGQLVVMLILTI
jgi:hypothetical protein